MKNRVFRCIEHQSRGFLGVLIGELIASFSSFAILLALGRPLVGIAAGAAVAALLAAWRRRDADREDYAAIWCRRFRSTGGNYRVGRPARCNASMTIVLFITWSARLFFPVLVQRN